MLLGLLNKPASRDPSIALANQRRLKMLIDKGGCQKAETAESVLERLQAHLDALRVGMPRARRAARPRHQPRVR